MLIEKCHHLVGERSIEQATIHAIHVFDDIKQVLPLDCLVVIFRYISIKWVKDFNVVRDILIKLLNTFDLSIGLLLTAFLF